MSSRRRFLKLSAFTTAFIGGVHQVSKAFTSGISSVSVPRPIVISTWRHGLAANEAAWKILSANGKSLDAVEAGVMVTESDPNERSVGYGGLPDRDGKVTLDACIMDSTGNCGAVACLEHIKNPVAVARKVMEKTPHVMLVGKGALDFALANGFKKENLLTPASEKDWKEWLKTSKYKPIINVENHDTIGMLAMDSNGNISGSCTTSGLAYKMHGRVGDSPIIGAGLYVDNEIGGACATGLGEAVIKIVGSYLVVEMMRQGKSPSEACRIAVERIMKKQKNYKDIQVGFIALNKNGDFGGYSLQKGFDYAVYESNNNRMVDAKSIM